MSTAAKAHEPTMEEILASIRRIISDDEPGQPMAPKPSTAKAPPAPEPAAPAAAMDAEDAASALGQDDIDAMFASFDAPAPAKAEPAPAKAPAKAEPVKAKAPEPAPVAPAADDLDVFDLTEDMAEDIQPPPAAAAKSPEPEPDPDWGIPATPAARAPQVAPPAPAPMYSPSMSMSSMEDRLLSGATNEAVTGAFGALANTILATNARTLDDLVKDMLRPMLREWLDDNLPPMVERLVKQEIERVARGGR